jgi:glucuronoarabinoxylan endo-1,4-beta-xylanase
MKYKTGIKPIAHVFYSVKGCVRNLFGGLMFLTVLAVSTLPGQAGVTVVENVSPGAKSWPGSPFISTVSNPTNQATVPESFNNANTSIGQTFTVTTTNYVLQTIDVYAGSGSGGTITLNLYDLGSQTAPNPSSYSGNVSLLGSGSGLSVSYFNQPYGVLEIDFTGSDQVILLAGHMYAFELAGTQGTTPVYWQRAGSDTYSGGAAYRDQGWINGGNNRDFALAAYGTVTSQSAQPGQCTVGWNDVHQKIDGFGGGVVFLDAGLDPVTDANMNTLFGSASASQLGLSILRVRIAPDNNWSNALSDGKKAKNLGASILATPWTPPASMKSNNNPVGGSLLTAQYASYAAYLNGFAAYMATNGASLAAISVQNEPDITVTYESCSWTATQLQNFFHTNAPAITNAPVMMPESYQFDFSLSDLTLNDATAVTNVDVIGGHLYGTGTIQDYANAHNKGKPTWMTEYLVNDQTWSAALVTAQQIHGCLTVGNMSAYIWWKCLGDTNGLVNAAGTPQKRGFVMSQFSRFVRPGYYRIGITNTAGNTLVSAYKDPVSGGFAIVAINNNSTIVTQTVNLANFTAGSVTPWITSSTLSLSSQSAVTVTNSSFIYPLPALSVVTFVGQNSSNSAPTDISLSNTNVAENLPFGTTVGTFSTTDPDAGNTFTYSLVSGTGSADNSLFTITNNTLYTAASFNYEVKSSYSIRVRSTDQGGLYFEKAFTITVTNVNETPTDISLSNTNVAENLPSGTAVGNFSTTDPDAGNTFTYTLVSGTGSADNGFFNITNNTLYTAASFNYEVKSSYNIRVRSTDQGGLYFEKAFTITVTNVNEAPATPTNISPANGATNQLPTLVLQTSVFSDPDAGDTHAASEWLVWQGSTNVFDSGTDPVNKTNLTMPSGKLEFAATYNWQVRFQDNHGLWSGYSTQTMFATAIPTLNAAGLGVSLVLSWPTNTTGFSLESTTNLLANNWSPTLPLPMIIGTQKVITYVPANDVQFYRLRKP